VGQFDKFSEAAGPSSYKKPNRTQPTRPWSAPPPFSEAIFLT
jgi:hypothetical protein